MVCLVECRTCPGYPSVSRALSAQLPPPVYSGTLDGSDGRSPRRRRRWSPTVCTAPLARWCLADSGCLGAPWRVVSEASRVMAKGASAASTAATSDAGPGCPEAEKFPRWSCSPWRRKLQWSELPRYCLEFQQRPGDCGRICRFPRLWRQLGVYYGSASVTVLSDTRIPKIYVLGYSPRLLIPSLVESSFRERIQREPSVVNLPAVNLLIFHSRESRAPGVRNLITAVSRLPFGRRPAFLVRA